MSFTTKPYLQIFRSIVFLLIVCLCASYSFSQTKREYLVLSVPNSEALSDHTGGYVALGKLPYEFVFEIAAQSLKNPPNVEIAGMLGATKSTAENGREYRFTEFSTTNNSISFKTEAIDNTYFEFKGKYLKTGEMARFYQQATPILEGYLTRYDNDKKALAVKLKFKYRAWKAPYYIPTKP